MPHEVVIRNSITVTKNCMRWNDVEIQLNLDADDDERYRTHD